MTVYFDNNATTPLKDGVKKAMAEAGISRDQVTASGRDGRVMKEDVAKAVAAGASAPKAEAKPAAPRAASAPDDAAREERVKMTRLKQTMARRLKEAQNTAAILTTFNEVDLSGVMQLRAKYKERFAEVHGVSLGLMSFFSRAVVLALGEYPAVNARIDGTDIVYHDFVNLGIAVSTDRGLLVPIRALGGSRNSDSPHRLTRASRASWRATVPASASPSGRVAVRSLALCTARSILPSSSSHSISVENVPRSRLSSAASLFRSPAVSIVTTVNASSGKRDRSCDSTSSVCARARGLFLVPTLIIRSSLLSSVLSVLG